MADLPPWHHERPWSQLELDDIRRNWAEHPERFSYAAGRWLATLAALPVATAGPDVDGEKAILDRVRRLAERADPDHVDAVVSFTRQNLAALRGAAAQADGGEPGLTEACGIEGLHHHQVASGLSLQFQPGHPISKVPERYRETT